MHNNIATLEIANPPVNALSKQVTDELLEHLESLAENPEVRVLLIKGAGEKAFMAGADIKEFPNVMNQTKTGEVTKFVLKSHSMYNNLANFPKPTIAILNGMALGGGCELALACDIRIAAEEVQLGLPEIKLGIFPGGGGTQRLPRLIGPSKAKMLMFSGNPITAEEAYRIGLVDDVIPAIDLHEKAIELAEGISSRPGVGLRLIKKLVNRGLELPLEEALRLEAEYFESVLNTEDAHEGVEAFLEKRQPQFKHM